MGNYRDGDRLVGTQVEDAGKAAFIPSFQAVDAAGAPVSASTEEMTTAIGSPTDAAWDGVAGSATVISLLKKIALNTNP